MPQLKVQNQYRTSLTSAGGIAASGDISFTVGIAPTYSNGYIVVSPDLATQREIMYFHTATSTTISVRAENRGLGGTVAKAHSQNEVIQMNDVAEIFNTFSDMIPQGFYVEKTGGLSIKVWGGYVTYNGNPQLIADTTLTLTNNTTNYIKYDFTTNSIMADTINSGNIKAVVITVGSAISSISYRNSKESYVDRTTEADFYKYSIVRTVTSGNLTVALKNYLGNDPTPSVPVKIQIGGVVRTITSGLGMTMASGTNYFNLGSAELATKEVDIFFYVMWNAPDSRVEIVSTRIPYATSNADFVISGTNEKGVGGTAGGGSNIWTSTNIVQNIGRFNATLSAGGAYTWSIPATDVIINSPIYETRKLSIVATLYGNAGTAGTATANYTTSYQIKGSTIFFDYSVKCTNVGSWAGSVRMATPFAPNSNNNAIAGWVAQNGTNPATASKAVPTLEAQNLTFLTSVDVSALTWGVFVVNDHIRAQGFYNI